MKLEQKEVLISFLAHPVSSVTYPFDESYTPILVAFLNDETEMENISQVSQRTAMFLQYSSYTYQNTSSKNIGFDSTIKSSNTLILVHGFHHC